MVSVFLSAALILALGMPAFGLVIALLNTLGIIPAILLTPVILYSAFLVWILEEELKFIYDPDKLFVIASIEMILLLVYFYYFGGLK